MEAAAAAAAAATALRATHSILAPDAVSLEKLAFSPHHAARSSLPANTNSPAAATAAAFTLRSPNAVSGTAATPPAASAGAAAAVMPDGVPRKSVSVASEADAAAALAMLQAQGGQGE